MEKIKEKKWFIVAVAVLFLIIAMALALKNNATDINGKWVVAGYNINGKPF